MATEMEQEFEWVEAQKIEVSVDLVPAAKRQLEFLSTVDKNRCLYGGPALQRAIYRYNACWLPLLAKHSKSQIFDGPLVVPLDCEWIWHCHRLNPVQYKADCEELYGEVLDNSNVVSSMKGSCERQTKDIWNRLYPEEPYNLDLTRALAENISENLSFVEKCTKYDLVSAVERQSPFCYQVSRAHMNNDIFLEEAVARYKGFLHLIKRNREGSIKRFCVPTYDIDLIWHTHQLHPASYCKDLTKLIGKVLEHDDMDADRTKGKKLDVGFSGTTAQWEKTLGTRYWKAGAMYRGSAPSPLTTIPFSLKSPNKESVTTNGYKKLIQLPDIKVVEVVLEIVGVKNLADAQKGSFFVLFSKTQPDRLFNVKRKLTILSESGKKQVASFQCEPTGELLFELVSCSIANLPVTRSSKTIGTGSFSLQEFIYPASKLSVEKWLELTPRIGTLTSKPIGLRVAISCTPPTQAPSVLRMVRSRPFSKAACLFSLPGKSHHAKSWTRVINESQAEVISLQMRDTTKEKTKDNCMTRKQVIGIMESGETCNLADSVGTQWSFMNSEWLLKHNKEYRSNGHLFVLEGTRMVRIFPGRKLDYEHKHCEKQRSEQDFMTAAEFSSEHPYGKAVALLDLKSGDVQVKEDWLVLPAIISSFILCDILKREGYDGFTANAKNVEVVGETENLNGFEDEGKLTDPTAAPAEPETKLNEKAVMSNAISAGCSGQCGAVMKTGISGECSGVCGGECGVMTKTGVSGGCSGGCSGECGVMPKTGISGGCSGVCSGECGVMTKTGVSGGCGGGCSGECGVMTKIGVSGGCGGGCSGECGVMTKTGVSGGCGGGCSGECGVMFNAGISGGCSGVCSGECGVMMKTGVSGGCGSGCSGGCGSGGCGNKFANGNIADDHTPCNDEYPKEIPVYVNQVIAA